MEPPEIERLDEQTIQRIAAGEVVERPASVVKELVENSLDAGASRVAVSVEAGGTEGIRVRDDGVGIEADQLEAAVAEHATSKIGDIDDLDAGVATLGFRGEALYTVGGVSRLTVRAKPPDADVGAEISVEGGSVGEVRPAGCPTGTVVEVDDLFYNTPARKKFLKRVATEFDHVNTVVTSYALANPNVAVSLEHDGRETFATEGNGDLRSAVLAVYGREVAEGMLDVDWRPDSMEGGESPPVTRVTGLVSHPETTRASRDYLGTYVNGRYVTASSLRDAVLDAYDGQLAPDRYPFTVLFVEVPPDDIDVNVHPRKLEVRFDEEAAVWSAVEDAVGSALLDHGLIRSTAPRGQSAPDEVAVEPELPDAEAVGGAGSAERRPAGRKPAATLLRRPKPPRRLRARRRPEPPSHRDPRRSSIRTMRTRGRSTGSTAIPEFAPPAATIVPPPEATSSVPSKTMRLRIPEPASRARATRRIRRRRDPITPRKTRRTDPRHGSSRSRRRRLAGIRRPRNRRSADPHPRPRHVPRTSGRSRATRRRTNASTSRSPDYGCSASSTRRT